MTTEDTHPIVDVVGIGFGPANIALAVALREFGSPLDVHFIERQPQPGWQDEMLLPGADIQHHPMRDLATPINPRSRYTFVNFLFERGRLFEHFNLPPGLPWRSEYREYIRWVAGHFADHVRYADPVVRIEPIRQPRGRIGAYRTVTAGGRHITSRAVVLAPGRSPRIPAPFEGIDDPRVAHLTRFRAALDAVQKQTPRPRVAVIGGSQSAVELMLHLAQRVEVRQLTGIVRSFGIRQKDSSSFSREVYLPRFIDLYYHADEPLKARLRRELHFTNYSSADKDVLDQLYLMLYHDRLEGRHQRQLLTLTDVADVRCTPAGVQLGLAHAADGQRTEHEFDLVVLATGFKDVGRAPDNEPLPSLLRPLEDDIVVEDDGLKIDRDYRVRMRRPDAGHAPVYLNGLCEASHGMGDSGAFSLVSLRATEIMRSLEHALAADPPMRGDSLRESLSFSE